MSSAVVGGIDGAPGVSGVSGGGGGSDFTPSGSGYAYLGDSRWVNLDSNQYSLGMFFDSNGLNFKENGDNQNAENLIWSQLNNDTFMGFGGIYYVAA